MKKRYLSFAPLLLGLGMILGVPVRGADSAAERWARYEPDFKAFAETDRAQPPGQHGILFVGSSIFRQWTNVTELMAPLPVLNRAFGGSRTQDQLDRFDQVVPPYAPRIIVYYCGSNDLKAGATAEDPAAIFARFREFSERVRTILPQTQLVYVASFRSPDRVPRWEQVDHYNALARAYCSTTPNRHFIDLNPVIVSADGHPRLELFRDDKLHYLPAAYVEFAQRLKPALEKIWQETSPVRP